MRPALGQSGMGEGKEGRRKGGGREGDKSKESQGRRRDGKGLDKIREDTRELKLTANRGVERGAEGLYCRSQIHATRCAWCRSDKLSSGRREGVEGKERDSESRDGT